MSTLLQQLMEWNPPPGFPVAAEAPPALPTAFGAWLAATPVLRRGLADRLVDQAVAQRSSLQTATTLLLKSLAIDPAYVNAYYWLATLLEESQGSEFIQTLEHIWETYGARHPEGRRFLDGFRRGRSPYRLPSVVRASLGRAPALVVHVADELDAVDLLELNHDKVPSEAPSWRDNGMSFIGRIEAPRLICSTRDFDSIATAKRTIAEDLVKLGKERRVVGHAGTWVRVTHQQVFGPAIDTLHYHHVLRHHVFTREDLLSHVRTVFEVGTGSGFLLCALMRALSDPGVVFYGSDSLAQACATTRVNLNETRIALGTSQRFSVTHSADALSKTPSRSIDLLLTNPPYLPVLTSGHEPSPIGGTEVLEEVILGNGPRVLTPNGVLLVLYSSLSAPAVHRMFENSPLVVEPLGAPRRVPLDLREISREPRWLEALRTHDGLEETLDDPHYAHWHTLHMAALYHRENRFVRANGTMFA